MLSIYIDKGNNNTLTSFLASVIDEDAFSPDKPDSFSIIKQGALTTQTYNQISPIVKP